MGMDMNAKYIDDISRRSCSIMKNGQQFLASLFIGKEKLGSEGYRDETVHRTLSPNLDYPYSRFSKEAERSIYQMAYNKLEKPSAATTESGVAGEFHVQVP